VVHYEKHNGGFSMVNVKDANGATFSTRETNCFVVGKGK